ncbi:hypothetical protein NX021_17035 [Cytobacillus firmus]|nr:hypothetical protein [Cytobacillus firmus]
MEWIAKIGCVEKEYIAFGNDANEITMFQHAMYSAMIGESLQLASFSSEQLVLSKDTENILMQRLSELGDINIINKLVNL